MEPWFELLPEGEGERFEVRELLSALDQMETVVEVPYERGAARRSPWPPETVHLVCQSPKWASALGNWIAAGRTIEKYYYNVAILEVTPRRIHVCQEAPPEVVEQVSRLLLPFLRQNRWRIFTERGEHTERYRARPEKLFEEAG
jgi:hypothetical protein